MAHAELILPGRSLRPLIPILAAGFLAALSSGVAIADNDPPGFVASSPVQPGALGDADKDLVYTPITPCRVADSRLAMGPIAAGNARNYYLVGQGTYAPQGGSNTDCGTSNVTASAVKVSLTAITPALGGLAVMFRTGDLRPSITSLSYAAGAVISNEVTVRVNAGSAALYSQQNSHYTIDVIGYYAPPVATALDCVNSGYGTNSISAGFEGSAYAPACPAGYTSTAVFCDGGTGGPGLTIEAVWWENRCTAKNNSAAPLELRAARRCCRVPGRTP